MSKMFTLEPPSKVPPTTSASTTTKERPPQICTDVEEGSTTSTPAPQDIPTQIAPVSIVYLLVASIQAMAQRLAHTKS